MTIRAAIFDLDGTLVDSLADIAASMNDALVAHGLPPHPEGDYRAFVGEGVVRLAERAAPAGPHVSLIAAFKERYAVRLLERTRPYPEIPPILTALAARGVRLAVLSNKPEPATIRLCDALFPGTFAIVAGDRPDFPRKPDPTRALAIAVSLGVPPAECAFIGDTRVDRDCALAAGMPFAGVPWGFRPDEVSGPPLSALLGL